MRKQKRELRIMNTSLPIKEIQVINKIKELYLKKGHIGDYLMFLLAINTGINIKTLLTLKVKDVKNKYYLTIGKDKTLPLRDELIKVIKEYIKNKQVDEPLFCNKNGKPIDRVTVFYKFKKICTELGLGDKYSASSWRKTFGYHYYQKYKDLTYLQWLFNQATVSDALKFINVDENLNLRYRKGIAI